MTEHLKETITLTQLKSQMGQVIGTSRWFLIDQNRIDGFANVTEDHQFIHTDQTAAKETVFKGTIAHGFLSLSLLAPMFYDAVPQIAGSALGVNYGFDKIRFLSPVKSGARIRGHFTLTSLEEKRPNEITNTWAVRVEIEQQDRPALTAQWIGLTYINS